MDHLTLIKNYSKKLWTDKDINAINDFFSPNATINSAYNNTAEESIQNKDKMKTVVQKWFRAFPDLTVTFEDFICEGNKVVSQWNAQGTHKGTFLGRAPTHNAITYSGITIYQIEDQKIIAYWAVIDMHKILEQFN